MTVKKNEIFLKDYKTPNYWVEKTYLDVDIQKEHTTIINTTKFNQNTSHKNNNISLNGTDLELINVWINEELISKDQYQVDKDLLHLSNLPETFELRTEVRIRPEENFTGDGFYKSGDIFCTQCEAEGYRRITYYLDRPDVMALFTTKITAPKKGFPVLLSNGNKISSGELADDRHFAIWEDPFKKPAYLFAMVAGDLALVEDTFTTKSNKSVALEIYVDKGNEDKCDHAMKSLQNSMKWDEDVFGLEYDLSIYMIVAVDSFNMGAMENKGLNIFNSGYVLAKKETATDSDFEGIEAVIGHEYFHNWTGNRVTCRDWFQLTLKEGLTVFRDQEFSSDMLSRPVKRIEDVKGLRGRQFSEDAGPLSHPIKPKSFVEINNFYTATIYDKGAEVIRMVHTLLGAKNFRKGMDLYFQRHDGQAVTTEDFISAMSTASGIDLSQFKVWYDQNGTPSLDITSKYNSEEKSFELTIKQNSKLNNSEFKALHMPFHVALYSDSGEKFEIKDDGKYELNQESTILTFDDISSLPIASLNCNFTAPVIVNYEYSQADLTVLMAHDKDEFNQYDAAQKLAEIEINALVKQSKEAAHGEAANFSVSSSFLNTYKALLSNKDLDDSFKSYALELPSVALLNSKSDKLDFEHLPMARKFLRHFLATELMDELTAVVESCHQKGIYDITAKAIGQRSLKNICLSLISASKTPSSVDLLYSHYINATNMTDEITSLSLLAFSENPYREKALASFYAKWKHETLVMQKWLSAQVWSEDITIEKIKNLESLEVYDGKVPNLLRALIISFSANELSFNDPAIKAYDFFADQIIEVDKLNPQMAAGMSKRLNYLKKLDPKRAELFKAALNKIKNAPGLSSDTSEVVAKNLG